MRHRSLTRPPRPGQWEPALAAAVYTSAAEAQALGDAVAGIDRGEVHVAVAYDGTDPISSGWSRKVRLALIR